MSYFVKDTNVPVVANGKSEQANLNCVSSCKNQLAEIRKRGVVILDDNYLIFQEYMKNLSLSGQPGPGDAFIKWLWDNQANPTTCLQVQITPLDNESSNFDEFPRDERLANFDRSDRKFVAVALSSDCNPDILNAADPDWADHYTALSEAGLKIVFLCPQFTSPSS